MILVYIVPCYWYIPYHIYKEVSTMSLLQHTGIPFHKLARTLGIKHICTAGMGFFYIHIYPCYSTKGIGKYPGILTVRTHGIVRVQAWCIYSVPYIYMVHSAYMRCSYAGTAVGHQGAMHGIYYIYLYISMALWCVYLPVFFCLLYTWRMPSSPSCPLYIYKGIRH